MADSRLKTCPKCGKTYKVQHTVCRPTPDEGGHTHTADENATGGLKTCLKCGKTYKKQHTVCKPAPDTVEASQPMTSSTSTRGGGHTVTTELKTCSKCGKTYKHQHTVCRPIPGTVEASQPITGFTSPPVGDGRKKTSDDSVTGGLKTCPKCGKTYKHQHTVCRSAPHTVEASQPMACFTPSPLGGGHSERSEESVQGLKTCPRCGKTYKHQHTVCRPASHTVESSQPMACFTPSSLGGGHRERSDESVRGEPKTCPRCGKTYKYQHTVCKPIQETGEASHVTAPFVNSAGGGGHTHTVDEGATGGLKTCPKCGKTYKHQHTVCRPASHTVEASQLMVCFTPLPGGRSETSDESVRGEPKTCPKCGKTYKYQHTVCRPAPGSASASTSSPDRFWNGKEISRDGQYDSDSFSTRPPASLESTEYKQTSDGQKVCLKCGKTYKRQHTVCRPASEPCSGSEGSASSRESRSLTSALNTGALEDEAQTVIEKLQIEASANPVHDGLAFFDDEVVVSRHEKETVAHAFEGFRKRILSILGDSTSWRWVALNSGSSYDGTKVTRADEVDCMFHPDLPTDWLHVTESGAPPGFCFVKLAAFAATDDCDDELKSLCTKGLVSSKKFREKAFFAFEESLRQERRARVDPDGKPGSPSFPVLLKAIPSADGKGMRDVSIDLVPAMHLSGLPPRAETNLGKIPRQDADAIRKAGFDVIPKEYHGDGYSNVRDFLWRLSFSRAEKQITKFADRRVAEPSGDGVAPPTCRKRVLRVLKRVLELCKGMDNSAHTKNPNPQMVQLKKAGHDLRRKRRLEKVEKFSTFQIRTLLWHQFYVLCPGAEKWQRSCARTRLMHALDQLKKMLTGRMRVDHFFVPGMDIMAEVSQHEREFLYIMFTIAEKLF